MKTEAELHHQEKLVIDKLNELSIDIDPSILESIKKAVRIRFHRECVTVNPPERRTTSAYFETLCEKTASLPNMKVYRDSEHILSIVLDDQELAISSSLAIQGNPDMTKIPPSLRDILHFAHIEYFDSELSQIKRVELS